MVNVITFSPSLLDEAAQQLARRIAAAGCRPTLLVGIRHGGAEVAQRMRDAFPDAAYEEVRLCRPDTARKSQGAMHRLLRRLPRWTCDILRMAESYLGEWRSRRQPPVRLGEVRLSQPLAPGDVVLLIDDAIDTGATLLKARQQLLAQHPGIVVRVAVITVTTPHPAIEADFCLYHNRTLCRFPWSADY